MQKIRQSNMELLRIIAMMLIILGHLLGQGGGTNSYKRPYLHLGFCLEPRREDQCQSFPYDRLLVYVRQNVQSIESFAALG